MGVIASQNWDGVTPPAMPSGWTSTSSSYLYTSAYGLAISASNVLELDASSPTGTQQTALYGTNDGNSGNVAVSAYFRGALGYTFPGCWVFCRYQTISLVNWYYWGYFDGSHAKIGLNSSSGVSTISSVSVGTFTTNHWFNVALTVQGSNLTLVVYDNNTGYYLDPAGSFAPGSSTCLTGSDTNLTGQGYSGLIMEQISSPVFSAYSDNWVLSTASSPPVYLPQPYVFQRPVRDYRGRPLLSHTALGTIPSIVMPRPVVVRVPFQFYPAHAE